MQQMEIIQSKFIYIVVTKTLVMCNIIFYKINRTKQIVMFIIHKLYFSEDYVKGERF